METSAVTNMTNTSVYQEEDPTHKLLEFKITKITFYIIILLLSITGNVLVIFAIYIDKKMRSSSHIFILHLAICDLLTPTLSIPFDLAYEEFNYRWPFGGIMCKVLWPSQTYFITSSTLILTAICIDRYRALVHPFRRRWRGKRLFLMVFSIFAFAAVIVVPYILVLRLSDETGVTDCVEEWPEPATELKRAYTMVLFLFQYGIPLLAMVVLYSIALYSLFYSNKICFPIENTGSFTVVDRKKKKSQPGRERTLLEQRKEQHFRVTKMFITVVIVFAISMFPNQILWLLGDYGNFSESKYFPVTAVVCRLFTYSNSVLNPFIYGLYSKEFRRGYIKAGKTLRNTSQGSYNVVMKQRKPPRRGYKPGGGYSKGSLRRALLVNGTNTPDYEEGKASDITSITQIRERSHSHNDTAKNVDIQSLNGCTVVPRKSPTSLPSSHEEKDTEDLMTDMVGLTVLAEVHLRHSEDQSVSHETCFGDEVMMQNFEELQESRC